MNLMFGESPYLVTGASSGIGREIALSLNREGANVVAIGRNCERLNRLKNECEYPERIFLEPKDLSVEIEALPKYVSALRLKYGKFQGLACCAGTAEIRPLQLLDLKKSLEIFNINYFSTLFLVKGFCDRRNNSGRRASIVSIASISALKCDKGHIIYSGSKAALIASMKAASREAANSNVRINCLSPSDVLTPLTQHKIEKESVKYPFGCGKASDVSSIALFLLSPISSWITGQNYVVDCGYM